MTEKKPEIPMTACKSSACTAFGYDAASQTLAVTYKGGKTYRYPGVPQGVFEGLREAKSVGKYLGQNVTGKFKPEQGK